MENHDARRVALLHREGIPQGFLSRLGDGFRAQLYRGISCAPRSGVWLAVGDDGTVVGFISGTSHVSRCYRSVLTRRGLVLLWYALPTLVRPGTWRHVLETLSYPKREIDDVPAGADAGAAEPTAELLSIVVAAAGRGTGAAQILVQTLEASLREWGHAGPYRVVTVADDPRSNAFYRKVGFGLVRKFRHHGIAMNLYHKAPTP